MLQAMMEACEDRHAARQAAREAAQANGQAAAAAVANSPASADTSEGYGAIHEVGMEQRSNDRGAWYSHIATDDEGEYFCKDKDRTSRNGRYRCTEAGLLLFLPPWGGHIMTYHRKAFGPYRRRSRQALARDIAASILAARQRGEQRLITQYTQQAEIIQLVEEQLAAAARDSQLAQEGESYPTTDAEHEMF
jgi:hypothetical protein